MNSFLRNLRRRAVVVWSRAWSLIQVELPRQEVEWLLSSSRHLSLLGLRRATMLVSRVRLVAALFAVLTPLWIIVDIAAFPRSVWLGLVAARVLATIAFVAIVMAFGRGVRMADAYRALGLIFAVPATFYLFCHEFLAQFQFSGFQVAFSTGYFFLPFVMLAGIAVFPLTLLETLLVVVPMLSIQFAAAALRWRVLDWPTFAASFWLLILISAVAGLAALSQLAFIIVLVREAVRDALTGCYSRRSGEELLELEFDIARRGHGPLAIAFIDLDHFKSVNDRFGHDAGDRVLAKAAACLQQEMRGGDTVIRWGGEEFVVIMPGADTANAQAALARAMARGIGTRPDGTRVTASIGVAERGQDSAEDWRHLVERADNRMYAAKQGGRDRIVAG